MKYLYCICLFFLFSVYQSQDKDAVLDKWIDKFSRTVQSNPDSAYYYITYAKVLSERNNNNYYMARCVYNYGWYYYLRQDFKKSRSYVLQSLPYAEKSNNYKIISRAYNLMGLIEKEYEKPSEALRQFLHSLQVSEKYNLYDLQSKALCNIGALYSHQKDTLNALSYYKKAEQIALRDNIKSELLSIYNNIAILQKDLKQMVFYINKANVIAIEIDDKNAQFNNFINLAAKYPVKTHQKEILQCLQQAEMIANESKDKEKAYLVSHNLGGYYLDTHKPEQALVYYKKALGLSKGIEADHRIGLYNKLSETYFILNNYRDAYLFKEKYQALNDSIFNLEKNKEFTEIQTKYEVEKKNLKINLLIQEKKIEENKKHLYLLIGIVLFLASLGLFFFFRHRIKTQQLLSKKEQELKRILGIVEGQDVERNRIAKDIHDGVGGKLAGIHLQLTERNISINDLGIHKEVEKLADVFQELRAISHNLSSNYISDRDLETLLYQLQQEYHKRESIELEILIYPENLLKNITAEQKHQLYRIVQEALTNISKHAKATFVTINITQYSNGISVIIEDDGIGFDTQEQAKGIGLKNIEERVTLLRGTLTIDSHIGKGSSILIEIPHTA
ncbi:signal transduction histidine kinase [Chryseobacterium defluvii]|uniref:Oxygen sensor histidine kinase NreB n=1 Tax=Chryseobacterium defluvii TaxID=160396 RepID=A0A840KJS1_9FLAO|nr:sensor histidine kinase [Chryseobacterium defluvii]MBB4808278.1 signal transduction histidine kinase [Chryseobacterium defluvii]